jgi:hypothetical protein
MGKRHVVQSIYVQMGHAVQDKTIREIKGSAIMENA